MHLCRGCDECIHRMDGPSQNVMPRNQAAPLIGHRAVHLQDTLFEPQRQFATQPFIKLLAALARGQPLDAMTQLRKCNHAEKTASSSICASQSTTPESGRGFVHSETTFV